MNNQSYRQWLEQQITEQRQELEKSWTHIQRIQIETKINTYRKALREWVNRGEMP